MASCVRLFLCGDVMTGRGIDQVLLHPAQPRLHETWVTDARDYINLAEQINGKIPAPVDTAYIWGDALRELTDRAPDLRLINLETGITRSDDYWRSKGIHYRMDPANIGCLKAAAIDCCALANNHVLDWGYTGLVETLETLAAAGIACAGAGPDLQRAAAPAVLNLEEKEKNQYRNKKKEKGRVLVFSFGFADSGIPKSWAARNSLAGVHRLPELTPEAVAEITALVAGSRRRGDIVIASIHWGNNWGYEISAAQRHFARALIDQAGIDLVHGHSSHHPKAIEVYRGKAVLYGCGDFINDYEGIHGYEAYRGDLTLMYFVDISRTDGRLQSLELVPMQLRQFRLHRACSADRRWLAATLSRTGRAFGTIVEQKTGGGLLLKWH